MTNRKVAEVFSPGEILKEELEARGWTQSDLAEILGRPVNLVNDIISGKRGVTPETARGLGDAFPGTSAQFWLNLESTYRLSRTEPKDDTVARRSKLYERYPVKEMIRRHWIHATDSIDDLERRFLEFFELPFIDSEPTFAHAARKSTSYETVTWPQRAWMSRAKQLSRALSVKKFSDKSFVAAVDRLRLLLPNVEDTRLIPRILAEAGIRFVVIEPLSHTRIDGVCFWLDKTSPVIALSLRYDRIDWFWHTLWHELGHIKNRDGLQNPEILDTDIVGEQEESMKDKPENERTADGFACECSIASSELERFVARVRPLYSKQQIKGFASRIGVHPGIVVGQLQHRGEIPYAHSREMLMKVRHVVTSSALTDGYGYAPILKKE